MLERITQELSTVFLLKLNVQRFDTLMYLVHGYYIEELNITFGYCIYLLIIQCRVEALKKVQQCVETLGI